MGRGEGPLADRTGLNQRFVKVRGDFREEIEGIRVRNRDSRARFRRSGARATGCGGRFEIVLEWMLFAAAVLGFTFGFVGSVPIAGPVAVLVFGRGLDDRARSALCLASGAAVAEGAYAYVAFRGFAEFLTRYAWIEPTSRVAAAVILTGLGLRFARGSSADAITRAPRDPRIGNTRSFVLGLALTALNPMLIATWTAAVTVLYSIDLVRFDPAAALPFSLGACAGVTAWFAMLLGLLQRFRARISHGALDRLIRGMGVMLILLGLGFAARFAYRL
jgi:threonine/homoserine/homoserine lactone efflux protein